MFAYQQVFLLPPNVRGIDTNLVPNTGEHDCENIGTKTNKTCGKRKNHKNKTCGKKRTTETQYQ